jgi:hypothetical protein
MIYSVGIDNLDYLEGITAACEAYNSTLGGDHAPLATNNEYVQFVIDRATCSYAKHYKTLS